MTIIDEIFGKFKSVLIYLVNSLSLEERRVILGELSIEYGRGGQKAIANIFNAGRDTVRQGEKEFLIGEIKENAYNLRGRKKTSDILVNLEKDIIRILETESQTDPKFRSTRIYTRMTINHIRKKLIEIGYSDKELPSNTTLNKYVNELGYSLKKVQKVKPIFKIPETNDIFESLGTLHRSIEKYESIVRISIDTKDKVKIGEFSRGGKSRVDTKAIDHDFGKNYVTPFGILNVTKGEVDISLANGFVSADFMVDRIEEYLCKKYHSMNSINLLVINADNGSENNSSRTQFIKRLYEFASKYKITVLLAYYPPYHSKYNPIERVWGILENHWNGSLLDCKEAVVGFCKSMTWNKKNPTVNFIKKKYYSGVKVPQKEMKIYNSKIIRSKSLPKWFVVIQIEHLRNSGMKLII